MLKYKNIEYKIIKRNNGMYDYFCSYILLNKKDLQETIESFDFGAMGEVTLFEQYNDEVKTFLELETQADKNMWVYGFDTGHLCLRNYNIDYNSCENFIKELIDNLIEKKIIE